MRDDDRESEGAFGSGSGGRPPSRREVLPHLEGLRGVAVLGVLLFHLGAPGALGGFAGVDVFFVLSGYLITGLLLRERRRSGRVDLVAFYARRARRVLPAAIVTIAVTVVAAALVLAPLDVPRVTLDGAASALSIGNIRFAIDATDYFAEPLPSPFRHFWSLGVEEQFYLFWPVLIIAATAWGASRRRIGAILGAVVLASLGASIALTMTDQAWAFYSFPTRAWQLGLGGLLAVAGAPSDARRTRMLAVGGVMGLAGVIASFVALDGSMPYPGFAALLPSLAAAAVIVGGETPGPAATALGLAPVRWLGRISYSLYLWHWPILVLPVLALGRALSGPEAVALAALSIAVAGLSWRFVEEPFRRGWTASPRLRRTLVAAASAALVTAIGSVALGDAVIWRLDVAASEAAPAPTAQTGGQAIAVARGPSPGAAPATLPTPPGQPVDVATETGPAASPAGSASVGEAAPSSTLSPGATPSPGASASPDATAGARGAGPIPLPPNVRPPLLQARGDDDPLVRDRCGLTLAGSDPPACVYGQKDGSLTVAIVGDSHAEQWFPALERLAIERGWRLLPFTKYSCPFLDMRVFSPYLNREYTECEAWRPKVVSALQAAQPDLVIVTSHRWFPTVVAGDGDPTRQGQAMARLLAQLPGRIVLLADTPVSDVDVPACLSGHLSDIRACETDRLDAFGANPSARERVAARLSGATLVDLSDVICPRAVCPVVSNGMIVYRDNHHLTATFAASLADVLGERLPVFGAMPGI